MIEKARLFAGKKGAYLDATVFIDIDTKDQYDNNGMITQDIKKEEKDAGVQGAILGNCQVSASQPVEHLSPSQIGSGRGGVEFKNNSVLLLGLIELLLLEIYITQPVVGILVSLIQL